MENNKEQNPIDDLFASELGGYEMNVEGNAWAKFEASFPVQTANAITEPKPENKEKRGAAYWFNPNFYRAAAAILLVFSLGFYLMIPNAEAPKEVAYKGPEIEITHKPKPQNQTYENKASSFEPGNNVALTSAKPMMPSKRKTISKTLVQQENTEPLENGVEPPAPEENNITKSQSQPVTLAVSGKPNASEDESFTYQLELRPSANISENAESQSQIAAQTGNNPLPDSGSSLMGRLSKMAPWNQINSNEIAYTRLARLVRPAMSGNEF